jgi:DNA-binding transcriptional regulator YhcF (GntR family)
MAWDFKDDRPIYAQVIEQIQKRIVTGQYKLGERLPSVRDLAAEAAVNPNTMQRALTELERLGLMYSNRTSGRMITDDKEKVMEIKENIATEAVDEFLENMKSLGYGYDEMLEFVKKYVENKK